MAALEILEAEANPAVAALRSRAPAAAGPVRRPPAPGPAACKLSTRAIIRYHGAIDQGRHR
jgi:hypothetical protein